MIVGNGSTMTSYSLGPRPPPFLPSICVHNNTRERSVYYCEHKREIKMGEAWDRGWTSYIHNNSKWDKKSDNCVKTYCSFQIRENCKIFETINIHTNSSGSQMEIIEPVHSVHVHGKFPTSSITQLYCTKTRY